MAKNPKSEEQNTVIGAASRAQEWVRMKRLGKFKEAESIREDIKKNHGMDVGHSDEKPFYILTKL
jgi:hypothetical protein